MNNSPSDQNNQNTNQTPASAGPETNTLYSAGSNDQSAYSNQLSDVPPTPTMSSVSVTPDEYVQASMGNPIPPPGQPPDSSGAIPPPPFTTSSKSRLLVIAGIIIFLLIVILGVVSLLRKGGGSTGAKSATLQYWGLWEDNAIVQPLIDEFQKTHPTVKIVYSKQSPKEYRERLQAAIERGEGPDIFRFHNTWTPMLSSSLAPIPNTVYPSSEFDTTFYPVVKRDVKIGQNYYGIPLEIDGLVVLYNEDILKAANVVVPTTWEEFRNAAIKLTVKDTAGKIQTSGVALGSADNIEHFSDIVGLMFLQNGTNLHDPLGPCTDTNTSSCAVDSLLFYHKFAEVPNNTWDDTMDNSIVAFAGGKVAMIFAPTWEILTIKAINPDINLKVAPVPQLPGTTINWASYWLEGVSKRSKNQLAAWEFLKFLSSSESVKKMYTEQSKTRLFGEPYARVDLASSLSSDPFLAALMEEAPTMESFPLASNTQDNGVNDQNIKYLLDGVNSLNQGGSAQTALDTISNGFKQILGKFGYLPGSASSTN